jgi:glycosyltransferase involved in cell wall biosynthesis
LWEVVFLSIVIATFNRSRSLLQAIHSLAGQTYPSDQFEVIVVDDGSTDGTSALGWDAFPFPVRYYWQENSGATRARNAGALHSSAEILLFMDDDIVAAPNLLEFLVRDLSTQERVIVLPIVIPVAPAGTSPFTKVHGEAIAHSQLPSGKALGDYLSSEARQNGVFIPFVECMTGMLAVNKGDFIALGMFQDPTGGWPNWDDVDFGYRAHLRGYRLWRSCQAVAYHHDRSLVSLEASCARWQHAGHSAVWLFKSHPGLRDEIPMFRDKHPISWKDDSLHLILFKVMRTGVSSSWSVSAMRRLVRILEKRDPDSSLLAYLYRWIVSASIYRGYRQGLREDIGGNRQSFDAVAPNGSHQP